MEIIPGGAHVLCLDKTGNLYSSGLNNCGQLGLVGRDCGNVRKAEVVEYFVAMNMLEV
jgi:alpha-tubulin suppressor-like RCC1 family protein